MRIKCDLELMAALRGMTMTQLAQKAGMSDSTLSKIRHEGSCKALTAVKLAQALDVEVDELTQGQRGWNPAADIPPLSPKFYTDEVTGKRVKFGKSEPVLCFCPDREEGPQTVGFYIEDSTKGWLDTEWRTLHPTHWMELPESPEA